MMSYYSREWRTCHRTDDVCSFVIISISSVLDIGNNGPVILIVLSMAVHMFDHGNILFTEYS